MDNPRFAAMQDGTYAPRRWFRTSNWAALLVPVLVGSILGAEKISSTDRPVCIVLAREGKVEMVLEVL